MEIEVGEYIRSKNNGAIARLKAISNYDNKNKMYEFDRIIYSFEEETIINMEYILSCNLERDILKHSKNIIDLIEVGDYVNGYEVKDIDTTYRIGNGGKEEKYLYMEVTEPIYNNFIVTVLTKEMFERVEYRVGE